MPGNVDRPDTAVERFDLTRHDVSRFACGNSGLDAYIRNAVIRDEEQYTAIAYALVSTSDPSDQHRLIGYFTLSSFSLAKDQARRRDRDKYLGAYNPVPAVLVGRLALDTFFQGQGLGSALLIAALTEILAIRERIGVSAAVVHAIDEAAARFYEHQGFARFRDEPSHLYYPLATFAATLNL